MQQTKIIDLFCGVGGFSLGASRAGFSLAMAVDNDARALAAHERNFPGAIHLNSDLSQISGLVLLEKAMLSPGECCGIVGGPPCQGFSCIGRRDRTDVRNSLFEHFFRLVSEVSPRFFLCENVPGIMRTQYESLRERAFLHVREKYILIPPMVLRADDYGAPTTRKRVFFFGYRKDIDLNLSCAHFVPPQDIGKVSVKEALRGLRAKVNPDWQTEEQGWRIVSGSCEGPFGERLKGLIPNEVGDPYSIKRLNEEKRVSGCLGTIHTDAILKRIKEIPPGKCDRISKSRRLDPEGFCPTLRAGTGREKGSHQAVRPIHPTENRVITPREAARLQGFPDWFQFDATKWHSFRQIGNSISPILAELILSVVFKSISNDELKSEVLR